MRCNILLIVSIVIIVVLFIYVFHCLNIKRTIQKGGDVTVEDVFTIDEDGKGNLIIKNERNEIVGDRIRVKRNAYYAFVNKTEHPVYFGEKPSGCFNYETLVGTKNKKDFAGLANGTIFLFMSEDLPNEFFCRSIWRDGHFAAVTLSF